MKICKIVAAALTVAILLCGCSGGDRVVYESRNFHFTEAMATYMVYYTRTLLEDEMKAAGVDEEKPLSEQARDDGETWADYLMTTVLDNMERISLYCEAARNAKYAVSEGMQYKSSENLIYLQDLAEQMGMTDAEYVKAAFGDAVTVEAFSTCLEMMTLCEGYELALYDEIEVTDSEISAYADENPEEYLVFEALRHTTADKALADSLAAAEDPAGFVKIMSAVSGMNVTDSDKNGVADVLEVSSSISDDDSGEFAAADGRAVGDTETVEENGKYTVTMITRLPARDVTRVYDFRMIYISSESSTDPAGDAESLLDQWKEKGSTEEDFSNLAARYSDDPSAYYGGLYSGMTKEKITNAEIAKWVTGDRKAGDTAIIPNGDEGTYMVYLSEGGLSQWKYDAMYDLKDDRIDERIEALKTELADSFKADEATIRKYID